MPIKLLRRLFAKQICPYCFEPFKLAESPFRCSSPGDICSPERDDVLADAWRETTPQAKVIAPLGALARSTRCHSCHKETYKRLCPNCHKELPATTGDLKNYIFAVIGAKETGKSHYIAVLIDHWRKQLGPTMDIELSALGDGTRHRYREVFYNPIFKEKTTIESTKSGRVNVENRMPLIYTLTFSGRNWLGRRRIRQAVTLVFFDTAGEDLDSSETTWVVNKYIYRSQGIILLLDPLQLDVVREKLGSTTPMPDQNTETVDILERVAELIRNGLKLKHDAPIKIPLAVAFSKLDAVAPLIEPYYEINTDTDHTGGFDQHDMKNISEEMASLIKEWRAQDLLQQVENNFVRHAFFAFSALGCNPHADKKVPSVNPKRVEDPFLWLLHLHGLIKSRK